MIRKKERQIIHPTGFSCGAPLKGLGENQRKKAFPLVVAENLGPSLAFAAKWPFLAPMKAPGEIMRLFFARGEKFNGNRSHFGGYCANPNFPWALP